MVKSEWEIGLMSGTGESLEQFLTELKNNGTIDDFENLGDGDGHTISGVYIDAGNNPAGIFKFCHSAMSNNEYITQCEIKNLNVEKAYVKGGSEVGIIAGYASKVNFTNCHVSGYVEGQYMVGGMAGIISTSESASVVNCSSSAVVKGNYYCGGILSQAHGPITIENCTNSGNIFGYQIVSGIVGEGFSNKETITIKNCKNTGKLESIENNYYSYFGGVVGYLGGKAFVDSCVNEGEVVVGDTTSRWQIGGAFGLARGQENYEVTIQNCTNRGNLRTTFEDAGGLIGDAVYKEADAGYVVIRNCNNTGKCLPQQTDLPLVGKGYYTVEQ